MAPQYFENGDGTRPGRIKQMGHLLDLLRDNGIQDKQSLRDWIAGRSVIKHGEADFQVVTAQDLGLDDENRWHFPDFKIREVSVDCEEVHIRNSSNIIIKDCAFLGSLIIGNKTSRPITLSLDTVVVGERLIVSGNEFLVSPARGGLPSLVGRLSGCFSHFRSPLRTQGALAAGAHLERGR